jgi:broad specificity phosphatase PhoE
MRLLLIRHGQTPSNVSGALDTAVPGAPLTDLGHRQADAVTDALADEPLAAIYASPLVRTQLTAAPLAGARGLPAEVVPGLEEISAGDLEMRTDTEARDDYIGTLAAWLGGDLSVRMPGGEDGHAFLSRYDAALASLLRGHGSDATVAAFSHGAAIRVYTSLRTPDLDGAEARLANTGLSLLAGDPESGWRLERWVEEPLGGAHLLDTRAHDVTGESVENAVEDAVEDEQAR